MLISILTPNFSGNCYGRAYLLAKLLQGHYDVEIVGPMLDESIWRPLDGDRSIRYKIIRRFGKFRKYEQMRELLNSIDGDIVYASKPCLTTIGPGLLKKIFAHKPLVLDIDDWDMGILKENISDLPLFYCSKFFTASFWTCAIGEQLSCFADAITVSNSFLREKFGGTVVHHARDTEAFDPHKFDKGILRSKYNLNKNLKVVMFMGTPRQYKGVHDLIKAVGLINDRNTILIVVGIDDNDPYCKDMAKTAEQILNKRFIGYSLQPFSKIPEFLTIADIVVVPQKASSATVGQVPAKVFDAMAMAKPIITTDVSDLKEIVKDCGWVIEPDNVELLAKTIQSVLDDNEEADKRGCMARQKCIEKYNYKAVGKILTAVFSKYE